MIRNLSQFRAVLIAKGLVQDEVKALLVVALATAHYGAFLNEAV